MQAQANGLVRGGTNVYARGFRTEERHTYYPIDLLTASASEQREVRARLRRSREGYWGQL